MMTSMRPSTLNSYHFQMHDPGMAMGAEVVVAPGLFYVDCSSGLLEASEVIANGLNWYLWGVLLGRVSLKVKSEWLWG